MKGRIFAVTFYRDEINVTPPDSDFKHFEMSKLKARCVLSLRVPVWFARLFNGDR